MKFTQRTHTCGELRREMEGARVTLNGWVDGRRDLGGMIFIDLRDRYGKTQVVLAPQHEADVYAAAKDVRSEFVLSVTGVVRARPEGMRNPAMPSGDVEVIVDHLEILNPAETPPFEVRDEVEAHEELRLKYRYLDLRRGLLQRNLLVRHRMYQTTHRYFDARDFIEVETPMLMKSTPEGARDYLVPSRVHHGRFYALPQSPQTYKQLLMVAGLDRYVQIVKCFRDEDLRADRQPEFTQIDLEMSFVRQEDIFRMVEGLFGELFQSVIHRALATPFPRLDYDSAIRRFGSDKPDMRFGMEIATLNDAAQGSAFKLFADVLEKKGVVAGICVKGKADFSRKQLDALTDRAKALGAGGLVWMRMRAEGVDSPAAKFLDEAVLSRIRAAAGAQEGDLLLIVSDADARKAYTILGALRLELGRELKLYAAEDHALLWVVDFPLFQWDPEEKRFVAEHHPFTSPKEEDLRLMESDPGAVRANCYDLVWNGNEVASGSIRIHDRVLQEKVFALMGLSAEEANEKFGFLMNAFRYGAPPHGGIALGFDRMVAIFTGTGSIRDVIAFPKTNNALSLMDDSPSPVSARQLDELHIRVK